ncbi:Uncharacterized protein T310_4516 [Rasamsonia emersonii CBS 393.64]|uniref:Histone H4 n=1 Tax=Rasamsonia emersonii (strain ATCC 16479 / CBS 393.64 / IMI 116815) TaxID=1408163 RepID=A0A0F4YUE7_RASE3|nr:Uncharacterized protein T310_4516 [Rasamsonia emersonii CBS 393.64]KKA21481.1 Uncharacterized protein T310_4516 [Rasamsonia emersonii CBS 393.64]
MQWHKASLRLLTCVCLLRKLLRESVQGITKPAIRRGGVVRMKSEIYDEIRSVIRKRITEIVEQLVVLDSATTNGKTRKTVTTRDVVFVLNRSSVLHGEASEQTHDHDMTGCDVLATLKKEACEK